MRLSFFEKIYKKLRASDAVILIESVFALSKNNIDCFSCNYFFFFQPSTQLYILIISTLLLIQTIVQQGYLAEYRMQNDSKRVACSLLPLQFASLWLAFICWLGHYTIAVPSFHYSA